MSYDQGYNDGKRGWSFNPPALGTPQRDAYEMGKAAGHRDKENGPSEPYDIFDVLNMIFIIAGIAIGLLYSAWLGVFVGCGGFFLIFYLSERWEIFKEKQSKKEDFFVKKGKSLSRSSKRLLKLVAGLLICYLVYLLLEMFSII